MIWLIKVTGTTNNGSKSRQSSVNRTNCVLGRNGKEHNRLETLQPFLNPRCKELKQGNNPLNTIQPVNPIRINNKTINNQLRGR